MANYNIFLKNTLLAQILFEQKPGTIYLLNYSGIHQVPQLDILDVQHQCFEQIQIQID